MAIDKLNPVDKKEFAAMLAVVGTGSAPVATTTVPGPVLKAVTVASLTDSSGGVSGGATIPVVPAAVASVGADTTAATVVSVNASITALKNDVATLAATLNAFIANSKAAGQLA